MPGSGKSTLLADICRKSPQFNILANCWFDLPNYSKLEIQDLNNIPHSENTIVALDEGYTWLESRIANSNLNKTMTYNVFQSRKKGLYFLITAQLAGSIDNRFRQMAEIVVKCKATNFGYKYRVFHVKEKRGRRVLKYQNNIFIPYEQALEIYPLFNTYEIIESQAMRDALVMALPQEKRVELCDDWAKKMIKLRPDWILTEVKAYLWHSGETLRIAPEVHLAIVFSSLNIDGGNEKKIESLALKMYAEQKTWSRPNVKAHLGDIGESQKLAEPLYYKIRKIKSKRDKEAKAKKKKLEKEEKAKEKKQKEKQEMEAQALLRKQFDLKAKLKNTDKK